MEKQLKLKAKENKVKSRVAVLKERVRDTSAKLDTLKETNSQLLIGDDIEIKMTKD